ncbi:MAG TPA: hypothetical protein VIZ17_00570 [Acetobacteraceae bacterium]
MSTATEGPTVVAPEVRATGDAAARFVAILIVLLLAATFAMHIYWIIPNHDEDWYLIAVARMLDGGRYITDFMEPNPPLIMLLMAPPVILARLMYVEPYYVFALFVCLLIAASVLLVMPTLSWVFAGDPAGAQIALACYAAILSLHPAYQFGQREHLFVILFCPGLFWFAAREAGRRSSSTSDWVAIVLASIAVLIKPFYLLVTAILLAFRVVRHRTWRVAIDAPVAVMVAVTLLYGGVILFAFPEYLVEAAIQRQVYFGWDRAWSTLAQASRDAVTVLSLVILLTELGPFGAAIRRFLRIVYLAAAVCLVLGVAQKKGWPYQLLPTIEIAGCALAFQLLILRAAVVERRSWGRLVAVLGALVIQLWFVALEPWRETTALTRPRFHREPLISTLGQMAAGKSVLLLTSGFQMGFPSMTGARLAGRAPSQILVPGIVKLANGNADQRARAATLHQLAVQELVEDIRRYHPDFIAVDRRTVKQALPDGFDMLHFYDVDPVFVSAWHNYGLARSIPGWDLYARNRPAPVGPSAAVAP